MTKQERTEVNKILDLAEKTNNVAYRVMLKMLNQEFCEDAISRKAAIKALTGWETEPLDEDIKYVLGSLPSVKPKQLKAKADELIDDLIEELNILRIDIDTECQYCDPTGILREKYERANEMLDDCIFRVKEYINKL